jgi:hypothetical protein
VLPAIARWRVCNVCDLYFRKKDRSFEGRVLWGQDNVFDDRKLDFDEGTKMGNVDVIRLLPGDYELYNFRPVSQDFYVGFGKARRESKSKADLSLPFTIRPAAGPYIGELLTVGIKGQDKAPAGAYFIAVEHGGPRPPDCEAREAGAVRSRTEVVRQSADQIRRALRLVLCSLPRCHASGCDSGTCAPSYAPGKKAITLQD